MRYEFICEDCTYRPEGVEVERIDLECVLEYPIAKAPKLGQCVKCPGCKRKTACRVASLPEIIIKGKVKVDDVGTHSVTHRVDGQDVTLKFIDHKHTDAQYQRNLSAIAQAAGVRGTSGLGQAYYSEKHQRVVVDVASNRKDPLGDISRAQKANPVSTTTTKVNQPYKLRSKK